MGEDPVPGRLAALDQELAALDARLTRSHRRTIWIDGAVLLIVLGVAGIELAGGPPLSRWQTVALLVAVAAAVAGNIIQAGMLRSYRAEIRDLRARAGTSRGRGPGRQDLRFTAGHLCHAQTPA